MQMTQPCQNGENPPLYSRLHIQIRRPHLYLRGAGAVHEINWIRGQTKLLDKKSVPSSGTWHFSCPLCTRSSSASVSTWERHHSRHKWY